MDVKVKVLEFLQPQTYTKKDGQTAEIKLFVGETVEGRYRRRIVFQMFTERAWGDRMWDVGDVVDVSFNLESKEHKGRWYTTVTAWNIVTVSGKSSNSGGGGGVEPRGTRREEPQPSPQPSGDGNLPF